MSAAADHLHSLALRLRDLPLGETPGALTFRPGPTEPVRGNGRYSDHCHARPLTSGSIAEARAAMDAGEITAVELTDRALEIASRHTTDNVLLDVLASGARARAAESDRVDRRARGPLHGIPVTIKNNLDVAGLPTTCGSPVFADRVATADAAVVTRLREAGAVILGTTNLHEMAFGSTSVNPFTGAVANPRTPGHVAGGSSGGSAAAVALGIGFASLGTDAAGSIRMPASCCGVVGFRPTHGAVPLRGLVPTSMSHVDHIGPLTTSVADARLLFDVLTEPGPTLAASLDGVVVGLPEAYFWADLDREVEAVCRAAVSSMEASGARVTPVACDIGGLMPLLGVAMFAEAHVLHGPHIAANPDHYSPALRERLVAGGTVLGQDYVRALRARQLVVDRIGAALEGVDLLVMPTMPVPPVRIADVDTDPRVASMARHTSPFNQSGHPVISLPAGTTPGGLPVGLQLVGHTYEDRRLLALADAASATITGP